MISIILICTIIFTIILAIVEAIGVKMFLLSLLTVLGVIIGLIALLMVDGPIGIIKRISLGQKIKKYHKPLYPLYKSGMIKYSTPTQFHVLKIKKDNEKHKCTYDVYRNGLTIQEVLTDTIVPNIICEKILAKLHYGVVETTYSWDEPVYDSYSGEHCNDISHNEDLKIAEYEEEKI